jgi:hypothetical protein
MFCFAHWEDRTNLDGTREPGLIVQDAKAVEFGWAGARVKERLARPRKAIQAPRDASYKRL